MSSDKSSGKAPQAPATTPPTLTVYEPSQHIGFFRSWLVMLANIIRSRELIVQLFKRDFLAVYKKSFFGVAWLLIMPALGVLPVLFMEAAAVLKPGIDDIPYTVFALLSVTIWQIFAGTLILSSQALSSASSFILQVNFPHEALLVKQCAQQLAVSVMALGLAAVVLVTYGIVPHWQTVFLPLMIIPLFMLGAGVGLLLSVLGVVVTDLQRVLVYLVNAMLYITPVVYTADVQNPSLRTIITYNPLTYLVGDARDVVLRGTISHPDRYAWACAFALLVFVGAWRLFFLSERRVIEKLI